MSFIKRSTLSNLLNTSWYQYAVQRTGITMPNCFTYACARISEIIGRNQPLDTMKVRGAGDLWEHHAPEFTQQRYACKGALMIWKGGNGNYGHVAVVEDLIDVNTIEWSESNYGGELFRIIRRNSNGYAGLQFMGYLYHKDLPTDQPESILSSNGDILNDIPRDFVKETATFTCSVDKINIRRAPGLKGAHTGDWYENGMSVHYDGYVKREGYVWISWISAKTGNRHWMAVRETQTNKPYGTFH